jgi:hypothetical protein
VVLYSYSTYGMLGIGKWERKKCQVSSESSVRTTDGINYTWVAVVVVLDFGVEMWRGGKAKKEIKNLSQLRQKNVSFYSKLRSVTELPFTINNSVHEDIVIHE